jgi:hypothetical protein
MNSLNIGFYLEKHLNEDYEGVFILIIDNLVTKIFFTEF